MEQGARDAPAVLLLHGLIDSWRSFELVLTQLPESIHVFALSQRGHGDSEKPTEGYRIRDFASDIIDFLNRLDIPRAVIVGHSSHGLVAQRLAIDHPGRIAGLLLVSSFATLRGSPDLRRFVAEEIESLRDPIDPDLVRSFQRSTFLKPPPDEFVDGVLADSLKVPAHVWREAFTSLLDEDHTPELYRISAPTLLVWGEADSIVARSRQDTLLSGIRGAVLVAYEGVGHSPHWEEPRRFAMDLVSFVARV
jgi:pimeloyl-ACP methyl ester carboxylesterase